MPESMFGRPLQHLLPSHSPAVPDPHPPLDFKDFRFNSIGKQPDLLSRISVPQHERMDYHTPTPSPTYTPPPNLIATQSQSSSRRTLLQQLGDPAAMDGRSGLQTSTTHSNGSLASRILTNLDPSNDIPNKMHGPSFLGRVAGDASLIPPVEVLPQPPDSSPPTPASFAPTVEPTTAHSHASSPVINMASARTSRVPTPVATATATTNAILTQSLPVTEDRQRSLEPPSTVSELLAARHERLQAISDDLANLALTHRLPPPHSPSPGPSSVMQTDDNTAPRKSDQSQPATVPAAVIVPPSVNHSPSRVGSNVNDMVTDIGDSSDLIILSATLIQEYQTQRRALLEAAQNLNSTLDALHHIHAASENAFTHQIRALKEERTAFEHKKLVDVTALQQQFKELQQNREELSARESNLALREKESKAREDARKGMIARRQAQEEEKRAAEARKVQETMEQIDLALKEVAEAKVEAERAKRRFGQLENKTVSDVVPNEPQEGMDKEEIAAVKSLNDLLSDIERLRESHAAKLQKLEESKRTLRRLEEERKKRLAQEAERRRIVEEQRLRALAEAELVYRVQEKERHRMEAEKKRQAVAKGRGHAPSSTARQAPAEVQPRNLKSTETADGQALAHLSYPDDIIGSQQQTAADTRPRATHEVKSPAATSMNVDTNERAFTSHRTVLLPEIHISPICSPITTSSSKQRKPVSGGVKFSAPAKLRGGLPPKPLSGPPPLPHVIGNAQNFPATSSATPVSAEGGQRLSFPEQLASEINRLSNADDRSTPDRRSFPRTSKSQTILDTTNGGSQELNIGPASGVSPTHQNVNLRHLKRSRGRVEENDSGDRSVRSINVKKEEPDDHSRELAPSSSLPASLPPRPAVIPPPRPWMSKKQQAASKPQLNAASPSTVENNKSLKKEAVTTAHEQPRDALPQSGQIPRVTNASIQQLGPPDISDSLLLGPVHPPSRSPETTGGGHRPGAENRDSSSESATADALNGGELSRDSRKFSDEHRTSHRGDGTRRMVDHYSPPLAVPQPTAASPTQLRHSVDSWCPLSSFNEPRAEPMRAASPTAGRKRPAEISDNDDGHRARRQRGDTWVAQEHDHGRAVSYRSTWERRPEPELDERRPPYHTPPSPDHTRAHPSDIPRTAYDNRAYVSPPPEDPVAMPRPEQSFRRPERDDNYQRYQPPSPGYNADQYHRDDARAGRIYEPMAGERVHGLPDPPLLARMSDSQHLPPTANSRGRGRGDPSRGRGDPSRGRGRGNFAPRGGPTLFERLNQCGRASLGDRLT